MRTPRGRRRTLQAVVTLALLSTAEMIATADGAEIPVASAGEIAAALPGLLPGDTLVMANGVWTNQAIDFAAVGTAAAPITLRPETPGGVTLNGASKLTISGDWLVVDGLNFDGGALGANDHVVRFQGPLGEATNSRFTNSSIVDYNPPDPATRYFWVTLEGRSNRVDNNYFAGQNHSGVTVSVVRDTPDEDHHRIDGNHFADRAPGAGNGFETIRIGTSTQSLSDSYTVVENNLFERVDGEIEIISSKSGQNVLRHNTFRESAGTLTLRHGNDSTVAGNFFLGEGKDASGGVRVIGERQTVVNNYFQGLDGRADGAISISAGKPNAGVADHAQVLDAVIAHNTIVDVDRAAISFDNGLGSLGRTLLADRVTIANNLIVSTQDPLFEGAEGAGWAWQGNLAFGQSLGPKAGAPGITVADPQLATGSDGVARPLPTGPARDAAATGFSALVMDDLDGQPRLGLPDIGADEFSLATIVRKPLTAGDVGPAWLMPSDPSDACGPGGCGLQAEGYASLLDPDGDGAAWTVMADADALGGLALKAPAGDRVDLAIEPHDTIATYDVEFAAAGDYTAYVRARGFSGSSDSLFSPEGFGVDPDLTETLASDGSFRWETLGTSFPIGVTDVGAPLEFRLAMRERLAEIDAIVFAPQGDLSAAELDAFFAAAPASPAGDYNGDGLVDGADYTAWRDAYGQVGDGLAADGDGNGRIDELDYALWINAFGALGTNAVGSTGNAMAAAAGQGGAIPEPAPATLLVAALGFGFRHR